MKKKYFVMLLIALCFILTGCGANNSNTSKIDVEKEWVLTKSENTTMLSDEEQEVFDTAIKDYKSEKLELVALLGTQVVSGTNYMFLCQSEVDGKIINKILVAYKSLDGTISLIGVNDFDVKKYVNQNISVDKPVLAGGWNTSIPGKPFVIDEKIQNAFDKAIEEINGVSYYPITVLAHQEMSGTKYAILCYGRMSDQNSTEGIYLLTLLVDEKNNSEIVSIAAVDLKDYNK